MNVRAFLAKVCALFALTISFAFAGSMNSGSTAPVINDADIANYGTPSGTEKWFAENSAAGAARGQSFTTGGAAVRLKAITYQVSEGNGAAPVKTYAMRVGRVGGSNLTLVHTETATQNFSWTSGQYMTWNFSTPVLLEPNTTYAVDVGMTSSTSGWQTGIPYVNITGDDYAGGTSYTTGTSGVGTTSLTADIASDRIFHLDLEHPLDPVFSLVAPSPADDATDALASRDIIMTFSQNVTPGTGNLTIRNLTDNADTILPATDSRLTFDQNVVRINPAGLIAWGKNYAIHIDAGMFLGDGGAPVEAISDDTTWNFTTLANDPLLAAVPAIRAHITGSTLLTGPQIAAHKSTIDNQRQRFAESTAIVSAVFDLITTYDTAKGALFVSGSSVTSFDRNVTTPTNKNSVSPENYHWVVYTVMQHAMDVIYTAENLAKHEATLANYKFGSHASFPGPCPPPANPLNTHSVAINGSFPATFGRHTQMWTTAARKPTGTYLAPGTIATVTVPPALVNAGYKVRVGAHAWDLSYRRPVNRLERATRLYALDATTIKVASPYGGGIYIEVPYLANAGVVGVTVTGAARAPYFSAKSFHTTTPAEWNVEKTHPAPWADFQSEKFMIQVPRKWIYNMTGTQAVQLMADWDKAMDAINDLMGFPRDRGKETMYCQTDVILRASVHAPGYPAVNVTSNVNSEVSPAGYAGNYLVRGPATTLTAANTEFHEQGHAYGFPKFGGETESNVNLLQPAMLYRAFGKTIDEAQNGSFGGGNSFITVDTTAIAWMCVFSFSPNKIPMQEGEKKYQHKGHGKWMDIARIYATPSNPNAGWEKLGAYWKSFMQDDANHVSYGTNTDDLLLRLSRHVGKDIRPLFHFWGIHPQNPAALAAALAAENIPADPAIKDKLLHYKSIVPSNNAAFRSFCLSWWGRKPSVAGYWEETDHAMQWDETLDADGTNNPNVRPNGSIYVEASAAEIRNRIDELVELYFPIGMTPVTMSFASAPTPLDGTTVAMTAATVTAANPPVQYYFENTANGSDSGWISSPSWQQTGLAPGSYSFRVKARDALNTENNWSPVESVILSAAGDISPPSPDPMTFATPPFAPGETSISMTATTATDINGVEYYFDCTAGGGHDSGWQDSPTYIDTGLPTGVSYSYRVQARDKSAAQNPTAFSAAASATTTDTTGPALVSLDPANESPGIPSDANLTVSFNEPIVAGTGFITLKNLTDATQAQIDIADGSQVSILGPVLTINPAADLLEGKTYAIQIAATAIDDLPGNSFPGILNDTTWFFTILDPNPPDIASLSPADNSATAPYNANLVVTFNENVTLGTGDITIKNLTDDTQTTIAISDATQVSVSGAVLTINPAADLAALKDYAVRIAPGAITDLANNPFPGIADDATWNFTTVIPPATYAWIQPAGNAQDWTTGTNWQAGTAPSPITGDTVDFSTVNIANNTTLTLGADRTAQLWKFGDTSGTQTWTVNSGNKMILAGTSPTIQVNNPTTTLNNVVDGTAGLTKTGGGTLSLANTANTYSGGTVIDGGNLTIAADGSLGATNVGYTLNPVTVNANATINLPASPFTFNRSFILNNGASLAPSFTSAVVTVNGTVTGTGSIAPYSQTGASLTLANTANTFTGTFTIANGIQQGTIIVNSIGDGGIVNLGTQTSSTGNYGQANFRYGAGAIAPLVLNSRQFRLGTAGGGKGVIQNDNTNAANTITINTHLLAPYTGARVLELGGVNTGANTFAGNITDGSGTVSVYKSGTGSWTLSGTNTYSGTTSPDQSALTIRGKSALSPNSTISFDPASGSAGGGSGRLNLFMDDSGSVSLGNQVSVRTVQTSAAAQWTIFVGNNGGATTGSTLVLGKMNFASITDYRAAGVTLNVQGANGYRLQFGDVDLNWGQAGAQGFNPTTAPLTITGTVKQVNGRPATGTAVGNVTLGTTSQVLSLGGTAGGNLISGVVRDALDYPSNTNALPLHVTKSNTGDWTLGSANNAFTGTITLSSTTTSAGTLSYASASPGGANPIVFLQTSGSATLKYTGAAPLTMSGLITASALTTGTITLDASGATAADTIHYSNPSSLSAVSNNTGTRNIVLTGTNTGTNTFHGTITNNSGSGGKAALTKNGAGTWVLTGDNTHTGATNVNDGKLFVNGSTAASTVTVNANATLGGTGTIGGNTTVAANGKLEFDLGTAAASHDKLELATGKSLTFSGTSTLTITSGGGAAIGAYTLLTAPGGISWTTAPTLVLPAGWAATLAKSGNDLVLDVTSTGAVTDPYTSWAVGGVAFHADTNNDGVANGLAWLLGAADPSANARGKLPVASRHGASLRLVFRCLKSTHRGGAQIKVQSSNDLGIADPWTDHEAAVPDADGTVNGVVFDTTDDGDFIHVIADIPAGGASPDGRLFGRLHCTGP